MEALLDSLEEMLISTEVGDSTSRLACIRVRDENSTRHIRVENIVAASPSDPLAYRPAVFIVLCCHVEGVVEARFLAYNEEPIECRAFALTAESDLGRLRRYVIDRLVRMVFIGCPGVPEERLFAAGKALNADPVLMAVTLAEKIGESVRYRSRHCARIRTVGEAEGR